MHFYVKNFSPIIIIFLSTYEKNTFFISFLCIYKYWIKIKFKIYIILKVEKKKKFVIKFINILLFGL